MQSIFDNSIYSFPDCIYPPIEITTNDNNKLRHECAIILGKISRIVLRKTCSNESIESSYSDFSSELAKFGGDTLAEWRDIYTEFFNELCIFLKTEFMVKYCDAKSAIQHDTTTSLGKIISDLSTDHIHASCPFHLEDNVCHCICAMFRAINNYKGDNLMEICREGFTALLHDIAKKNCTIRSSKSVSYPAHCIGGSIMLRHCWNNGFLKWFTKDQYDMMCDIVCYHMCGCNSAPHEYKTDTIRRFPSHIQEGLRRLAIADHGGAIPLAEFIENSSIASSDELWQNMKSIDMSITDFMTKYNMKGVYISLIGGSAQGKSHTAMYIMDKLSSLGVSKDKMVYISRDESILYFGRQLLNNPNATYREAYNEIKTNILGKSIKQRVNDRMKNTANRAFKKGYIVIYDTCARNATFPSGATDSLRFDIHTVRTTCVTDTDSNRHKMTMNVQIETAGSFNIYEPFSEIIKGKKGYNLRDMRPVAASSFNIESAIHGKSPHIALTVSTVTRNGCELPNRSLDHFIGELATINFEEYKDKFASCNLEELLNYLDGFIKSTSSTQSDVMDQLDQWFSERAYSIGYPFKPYIKLYTYYLAVINGDASEKESMHRMCNNIKIAPIEDIMIMDRDDIDIKLKKLVDLNNRVITIKYIDGINRQWTAPWHIQSRTPICVYHNNRWHVISAMPRGPEVAGDAEHNIDKLQDVNISDDDLDYFAPQYQVAIMAMNGDVESAEKIEEIVCSSKRDGMCFRCIVIRRNHPLYEFWESAMEFVDDPIVTTFVGYSKKIIDGIVIPASNGTAFTTFNMVQQWFVCSIAISYGSSHDKLCEMVKNGDSATDILLTDNLIEKFLGDIAKIAFTHSDIEMHTWEAIGGPGRMCAFDKEQHKELASSYSADQCGISYLGVSCTDTDGSLMWIPHYDISHNFYEPSYWRFCDVTKARTALKDLGKVFGGEISFGDFFEIYPVDNCKKTHMPDPEGFVAYIKTEAFGKISPVYCKAKTWMYYVLHKIHPENIPSIIRMPEKFGDAFPGYRHIMQFFSDTDRIKEMITNLKNVVMSPAMLDGVHEKGKKAIERSDITTKFKIVLNTSVDVWPTVCIPIVSQYFPRIGEIVACGDKEILYNISSILRKVLMKLRCFDDNWGINFAKDMSINNISKTGKMGEVVSDLWELVQNYN